ncbi:MAG: DUF3619 family protein [Sideroxyarcus sp.]|nr:DUF3619 family protein [Sideroxyarcus sp.]
MNDKLNTAEIGNLLDQSTGQLQQGTLNSLRAARRQALQHQRVSASRINRDGTLHGHMLLPQRALKWVAAAVVATLLAINLTYWNAASETDYSHIDIAILTDDLPVDMFVK